MKPGTVARLFRMGRAKGGVKARTIARIIARSKLPWAVGRLRLGESYCALGILAKEAGVSDQVLMHEQGYGFRTIYEINDTSKTKEETVQRLCNLGDHKFNLEPWFEKMRQKGSQGGQP